VTGFGLLGHLRNIVRGSAVDAAIEIAALPLLPGALDHARAGHIPGGSRSNLAFLRPMLRKVGEEDEIMTLIAADAQTSGGLLLCVEADDAPALCSALGERGLSAATVGTLLPRTSASGEIAVRY
ncbi:MAG: AIR synthase-related protein, partial [Myxococcota bacterium]